ncbi:MAG: type II toxin-antitoxin system MqsA family antitoxin [Syntrophomonadaceae bacterium]|nr:type II toxin-antitoxin system MqsA family antitoxin [Syntrophomonadaceae bacterium]
MKCVMCKSKLAKSSVNHIVDYNGRIIIIKNVPANVCGQCGEYYIDNDTAMRLEEVVSDLLNNKAEILVLNYSEMVA